MRQEVILDALDMLDRDMIEAVDALREAGKCSEYEPEKEKNTDRRKVITSPWRFQRYAYAAACLCLLAVSVFAVNRFSWKAGSAGPETEEAADVAEGAVYSREAAEMPAAPVPTEAVPEMEEAAAIAEETTAEEMIEEAGVDEDALLGAGRKDTDTAVEELLQMTDNYAAVAYRPAAGQESEVMTLPLEDSHARETVDAFLGALEWAQKIPAAEVFADAKQVPEEWYLYRMDITGKDCSIVTLWLGENGYVGLEEQAEILLQVEPEVLEALVELFQ